MSAFEGLDCQNLAKRKVCKEMMTNAHVPYKKSSLLYMYLIVNLLPFCCFCQLQYTTISFLWGAAQMKNVGIGKTILWGGVSAKSKMKIFLVLANKYNLCTMVRGVLYSKNPIAKLSPSMDCTWPYKWT